MDADTMMAIIQTIFMAGLGTIRSPLKAEYVAQEAIPRSRVASLVTDIAERNDARRIPYSGGLHRLI
jgi:hypothetical protein